MFWLAAKRLLFRLVENAPLILIASGFAHLIFLIFSGADWEGATSPRKPALFGISGGLTLLSLQWISRRLGRKVDSYWNSLTSIAMISEVALITIQYWRGVPSHFNRSTTLDAIIEFAMVGLITLVMIAILRLQFISPKLLSRDEYYLSINLGLGFLTISGLTGFLIMFLGERQVVAGLSPEVWQPRGVLKFPHGIAIHAIQLLPFQVWVLRKVGARGLSYPIALSSVGHGLLLVFSFWQTFAGFGRLEMNPITATLFVSSVLFVLFPFAISAWIFTTRLFNRLFLPKRLPREYR